MDSLRFLVQTISHGDWFFGGLGRVGMGSTLMSTTGLLTTQNLVWLGGIIFGAATLAAQIWWNWYRERRETYIKLEMFKARMRRDLEKDGIDSKTVKALQQSPDPDSGD